MVSFQCDDSDIKGGQEKGRSARDSTIATLSIYDLLPVSLLWWGGRPFSFYEILVITIRRKGILRRKVKMNEAKKAENSNGKDGPEQSATITGRIYAKALELLEEQPEGVRFTELRAKIEEAYPSFHPKTVNGCVWKLVQKFPEKVYKPSRGVYRLVKYEATDVDTP
jgi:hypothetical protein